MKLGVVTSTYVFELSDYDGSTPWGVAQSRFEEQWTPEHLDDLLGRISSLGFGYVELWRPTAGSEQWTDEQVGLVRDSLARHRLEVPAYCVGGIDSSSDIEALFAYGSKLGASLCTGFLSNEDLETVGARLAAVAEQHGMCYGIENHGREHTVSDPEDIAALARRYPGRIGACPDTGNYERDGVDPLAAVNELVAIAVHTHMKDLGEGGSCAIGEGRLPMAEIVRALRDAGYSGVYSVEREGDGDPAPLLKRSCEFLRKALSA